MATLDPPLFHTPHGSVIHCACCGRIEITFRGERLRVSPSDFQTIEQTVARAWHEIQNAAHPTSHWRLSAETGGGTMSIEFSNDELAALHELLHGAAAMQELETMLHDVLHT